MNIEKTIAIMRCELTCVERQDTPKCNRECATCDLVQPTEDVIKAYNTVIRILEHMRFNELAATPKIRKERKVYDD